MNSKSLSNIYIDVGTSTVKIYSYNESEKELKLLSTSSLKFKENYSEEFGIAEEKQIELIDILNKIKVEFPNSKIKTYATSVFRKLSKVLQIHLIDRIFLKTGIYLNIISQELESFYLEKALIGKYKGEELVMLINIGGGSTELIQVRNGEVIEKINLDLGVSTILKSFPNLNDTVSNITKNELIDSISIGLPEIQFHSNFGIYNGGELNYMQLAGYNLEENEKFEDAKHPSQITIDNFSLKNTEVVETIDIKDLEALMPKDPKWMHGARACSVIAESICKKYGIEKLIPSNSNLIDGVICQEFRRVTLSGSYRKHLSQILEIRNQLIEKNIEILSPRFTEPKNPGEEFVIFSGEEGLSPIELERHHLESIEDSDALIVIDPDGYVGASALIEIGYANALQKRLIFVENPAEFMLNTLPREIL